MCTMDAVKSRHPTFLSCQSHSLYSALRIRSLLKLIETQRKKLEKPQRSGFRALNALKHDARTYLHIIYYAMHAMMITR